jgi:G:T-mismatch repair DNA endonuclease (very short patch repair protein)
MAAVRCRADLVFPRQRVAVFADGCFWHACPVRGVRPVTNCSYLDRKIGGNVERDRRNGEPCPRCGDRLEAVFYEDYVMCYCPTCQTDGKPLKDRRLSRLLKESKMSLNPGDAPPDFSLPDQDGNPVRLTPRPAATTSFSTQAVDPLTPHA